MKVESLKNHSGLTVEGPLLIQPKIFKDARGFFFESWNQNLWNQQLEKLQQKEYNFVQDNHSRSSKGVLRGLHYQLPPTPQGKLVRCIFGEIYDVAVDIRLSSVTFGTWVGASLTSKNHNQLWIPPGFAHGFLTLSDYAEVLYKTTDFWSRESERSIRWNDTDIAISWPELQIGCELMQPILSEKDNIAPHFSELIDEDFFV